MQPQLGPESTLLAIHEVAQHLGITTRAIRFYEEKGLIEPKRVGMIRIYFASDLVRLRTIVRYKRLGFSLREIGEFLGLYDGHSSRSRSRIDLEKSCKARISYLQEQANIIDAMLEELRLILARINNNDRRR